MRSAPARIPYPDDGRRNGAGPGVPHPAGPSGGEGEQQRPLHGAVVGGGNPGEFGARLTPSAPAQAGPDQDQDAGHDGKTRQRPQREGERRGVGETCGQVNVAASRPAPWLRSLSVAGWQEAAADDFGNPPAVPSRRGGRSAAVPGQRADAGSPSRSRPSPSGAPGRRRPGRGSVRREAGGAASDPRR